MWFCLFLFYPLISFAGLECHENDIKKTRLALEAVASSKCLQSGKIKAAGQSLRDLGYESLCDAAAIDKAKQIIADLRIDSWIQQDEASCQLKVSEALKHIGYLKRSPK